MSWTMINKKTVSAAAVLGVLSIGCGPGGMFQQGARGPGWQTVRADQPEREVGPEQIRCVQERLNQLNYGVGPVDGVMGPQTRGALSDFQYARGLPPTGRLDDQTLKALGVDEPRGQAEIRRPAVPGSQVREEPLREPARPQSPEKPTR